MLSQSIYHEIQFLLDSVLLGIIISFVYDNIRVIRRVIPHNTFFISVEDLLFWIFVAIYIFLLQHRENNGIFRWFSVIGALVGMMVYRKIAGRFYIKNMTIVLRKVLKLLYVFFSTVLSPIYYVEKKTLHLGKKTGRGIRHILSRQKIRLTSYGKTLKMTLCKRKKKHRKKGENMSRRVLDRKKRQNGFSVALVIMVILMLMVVISFKRHELKQKQEEYTLKEQQLLEQIAEEEERVEEIEEYRKYTQTQKYIEEVAKEKLGLVNENEIIFKSE